VLNKAHSDAIQCKQTEQKARKDGLVIDTMSLQQDEEQNTQTVYTDNFHCTQDERPMSLFHDSCVGNCLVTSINFHHPQLLIRRHLS
jgi:hypothetical protein